MNVCTHDQVEHYRVKHWDVIISGFTQGPARESGAENLFKRMELRHYVPGERIVWNLTWKADWDSIAEKIWRLSGADGSGRVNIYAYSWGGGWGFPKLSKALMKRDIDVEVAVLCDPVYRSWFLPTFMPIAPLSMTKHLPKLIGWPSVKVHPNVKNVCGFHQTMNRPCGHPLKIVDKNRTRHFKLEELQVDHQHIDDSVAWKELSLEVAAMGPDALHNLFTLTH